MHWVPEPITDKVILWRGYANKQLADNEGEFEGTFLSDSLCGMIRVRGMLVRRPGSLSIVSLVSLAQQLVEITGLKTLSVERHGKWKTISLERLSGYEKSSDSSFDVSVLFDPGKNM